MEVSFKELRAMSRRDRNRTLSQLVRVARAERENESKPEGVMRTLQRFFLQLRAHR